MRKILLICLFFPLVGFGQELSKDSLDYILKKYDNDIKLNKLRIELMQMNFEETKKENQILKARINQGAERINAAGGWMVGGIVSGLAGAALSIFISNQPNIKDAAPIIIGIAGGFSLLSFTISAGKLIVAGEKLDPVIAEGGYY